MSIPFSRLLEDQQIVRRADGPKNPLVSVILPTYKLREGMNQRAIESILTQTFEDFEVIIVDDGSLDGLYTLLQSYQERDARIVLVRHEINSGLPAGRVDEGILLARGKYIAYMFEDDCWLPDALKHLLATASTVEGDCLVYGSVEWEVQQPSGEITSGTLGAWDFNYGALKEDNKFANCAVLHTRSAMDLCGLYDPNILIRRASDYDLWLRMARIVPFLRCPHTVGRVISGTKYALGATIDQDISLTYRYMNSERNEQLLPENIHDYLFDEIPFATVPKDAARIHEHYITPFWVQHPQMLRPFERKLITAHRTQPNRILVTKGDYSTSVDVTIGNFNKILPSEIQSFAFLPERNLSITNFDNFDTLLLYRTLDGASLAYEQEARNQGKTVIYLMDDNMFKFGTGYMADDFDYLKPGTPYFRLLERQVAEADGVISYSDNIRKDLEQYNNRVIDLKTNIREQYVIHSEPIQGGKGNRCLKYAVLSGPARKKEIQALWPVFRQFVKEHIDAVEFHIWGMDPKEFGELDFPVHYSPFDHSYDHYLARLEQEKFDFVICPLFDDHDTKLSKSPVKYLEATAAGAVGIFSDSAAYQNVKNGSTGIKVKDDAWLEGLQASFDLSDQERLEIHSRSKDDILQSYTTESQMFGYLAAFEACDLHEKLRSHNTDGGQARIAYFFYETELGGATLHLLQHALIAQKYGFQPIICYPDKGPVDPGFLKRVSESNLEMVQLDYRPFPWVTDLNSAGLKRNIELADWLREKDIRMIHALTYCPEVNWAAANQGIPVALTLHQFYETPKEYQQTDLPYKSSLLRQVGAVHSSSLRYARRWHRVLNAPSFCIRAPVARSSFENYVQQSESVLPEEPTMLIAGTLQPRKRQLEAIKAVGILAKKGIRVRLIMLGYDTLVPDYAEQCRSEISRLGLEKQVEVPGFALDPKAYYQRADIILCSSEDESLPQSILKAMAEGKRVISTPAGGISELILDGFSGVIADSPDPEHLAHAIERAIRISPQQWQMMLTNARYAAEMSCREDFISYQLLRLYNAACKEDIQLDGNTIGGQYQNITNMVTVDGTPTLNFTPDINDMHIQRMVFRGLTYKVHVPKNGWETLVVIFATFSKPLQHKLEVTIRLASVPFVNLRKFELSGDQVVDNGAISIVFPPIYGCAGQNALVTFRVKSNDLIPNLGVYELGKQPKGLKKYINAVLGKGGRLHGVLMFSSLRKYRDRGKMAHPVEPDFESKLKKN